MALVHPDDAQSGSGEVVQDGFGHLEPHSEALQIGAAAMISEQARERFSPTREEARDADRSVRAIRTTFYLTSVAALLASQASAMIAVVSGAVSAGAKQV